MATTWHTPAASTRASPIFLELQDAQNTNFGTARRFRNKFISDSTCQRNEHHSLKHVSKFALAHNTPDVISHVLNDTRATGRLKRHPNQELYGMRRLSRLSSLSFDLGATPMMADTSLKAMAYICYPSAPRGQGLCAQQASLPENNTIVAQ